MELTENDSILFREVQQSNEGAFRKVYEGYYTRLCYYADKFINDFDQSRSVVQGVFVELWIKREKLNINYSVKAYLFNSVRNACIDFLRKKKSNESALAKYGRKEDTAVFRDYMEEAELNDRINKAILSLPEKCREIFVLCRFEELKYTEIAEKLGISIKTVEMQMGIALKRMRDKLSDYQWINLVVMVFKKK
ncbi:MAG: RNA polymerase sigma-70 factor [Chlorobi bacterium]|nr:RNA polymerase sigma-70 factor [Chlorobiota bacterium]